MKNSTPMFILFVSFSLTACGQINRAFSNFSGNGSPVCQGGVEYLQFSSGVSVAYKPDGKIKTCSN